jgi:putative transposase
MPRAHRYFLPNHIWHITHRCHQRALHLMSNGNGFIFRYTVSRNEM